MNEAQKTLFAEELGTTHDKLDEKLAELVATKEGDKITGAISRAVDNLRYKAELRMYQHVFAQGGD